MISKMDGPLVALQGQRIGILGGSFNPAHEGHLHISRLAQDHLKLDHIWWLVSPQNPLKSMDGMAPLATRMEKAHEVAGDSGITVTDIEHSLGTSYTVDTLSALKNKFPGARFVWLMGADNLAQIEQWHQWQKIFMMLPVAIFARPTYSLQAESAKAVQIFAESRVDEAKADLLADMKPPAWTFLKTPLSHVSATDIRSNSNKDWAE